MSVLFSTSFGDIVIDLYVDQAPLAAQNFLKLCQYHFYDKNLFFYLEKNFIIQCGDPSGTGKYGVSAANLIDSYGNYKIAKENTKKKINFFKDEKILYKKNLHQKKFFLGMSHYNDIEDTNNSIFFLTLTNTNENFISSLFQKYTILGEVVEGQDLLLKFNSLPTNPDTNRPLQDIRILEAVVLDDPTEDMPGQSFPEHPVEGERPEGEEVKPGLKYEEIVYNSESNKIIYVNDSQKNEETNEEIMEKIQEKEAKSRALVLEMIGDLPDAEIKPPEEVLFVCKLNPVTREEDLEIFFSKFGKVVSCSVIKDFKTGKSLGYAFVEYENVSSTILAYEKMNNALIDDRRIKVDFSQSVSKLWNKFNRDSKKKKNDEFKQTDPSKDYYREIKPEEREILRSKDNEREVKRENLGRERENRRDSREREREKDRDRRKDSRDREKRGSSRERRRDSSRDRRRDSSRERSDKRDNSRNSRDRGRRDRSSSREKKRSKY